jgi:1-acyl-sn-glycerol-3-phosphate acyltransferase
MIYKNKTVYRISAWIFRCLFRILGGFKVIGKGNIPKEGGVILAPNHISYVDPPAAGAAVNRQVHFMAKEDLFKVPVVGKWITRVGGFPVRRGTADRKAIKNAIELLDEGRVICLFPEGTRSPDGTLQEPELGIGLIALKSRAPIVPVALIDTDKVLPPNGKRLHRHAVTVVYGTPLTFPALYDERDSRQSMEEIGRQTMAAIRSLQAEHSAH